MKTLKTILAMITTLAMCVCVFGGCQASNPTPQSGNAPTTTTDAVTTTTTEATTTTTEPIDVYTVNEDRLAEIGKTFAEIKELYGEVIDSYWWNGGMNHSFERSEYEYFFDKSVEWGGLPTEDAVCQEILSLRADQFFNNLTETVSATKLAEMYTLKYVKSLESAEVSGYETYFYYNNYTISIQTSDPPEIGPDSKIVYIQLKKE